MKKRFLLLFVYFFMCTSHDLVDIQQINPSIQVFLMYAQPNNFAKKALYPSCAKCYVRKSVANKLDLVQKEFAKEGLGLKIYDGYRPLSVQKALWSAFPDDRYIANPYTRGSCHCRGVAVDVTLVDLKTGKELAMPTEIDDLSEHAHRTFMDLPKDLIANREKLETVMHNHGFIGIKNEWWHFNDTNWQSYDFLDVDFEQLS